MAAEEFVFTLYEEDGDTEVEHRVPGKFEVCPRCQGHGTHLTPSIGQHAYSQEEFEESFSTDEEKEAYFQRGGMYDVSCEKCGGERVVCVPNLDRCNAEQKKLVERWEKAEEERANDEYAERRMRQLEDGNYEY